MLKRMFAAACLLAPVAAPVSASAQDATRTYLTTPNFPLQRPLPVNAQAVPDDGLALAPGATNAFWLSMGTRTPGANMTTAQSIRDTFFMNYIVGDLTQTIGSPMDTGQGNSPFAAVARHYAPGDPNDLHQMRADGMALRAICSNNHTDCSVGHVYGGMVRVPFELRPDMTVEVRYRSPSGPYAWTPIWMLSGSEISPGPGGYPYAGAGTPSALVREPIYRHMFEIDLNDDFPRWEGTPPVGVGWQFEPATPDIYGVTWKTAPFLAYAAHTAGYVYIPNDGPTFIVLPFSWASDFHNLVMTWYGAANLICEFVDGVLVSAHYMEYSQSPTYVDASGATKVEAMHLMIGNQAVEISLPGSADAIENDGMPDGWTITVQKIAAWNGVVANPLAYAR